MIIISHRGNLNGIEHERENNPYYIDECIKLGFDVEIDLRIKDNELYLGHDTCQYKISLNWLLDRKANLWVHIKEYDALIKIIEHKEKIRFFCHESDKYTLLSNGLIWCHDLTNIMTKNCIIPLLSYKQVINYNQKNFYAVCTDYVYECRRKFIEK